MKKYIAVIAISVQILILGACGDSPEEKQRKAELAVEIVELRRQIEETQNKIQKVKLRTDSLKQLADSTDQAENASQTGDSGE